MTTRLTLGPASLVTVSQNQLYHIEAANGDLGPAMILVGDPHRAAWVAENSFRPGSCVSQRLRRCTTPVIFRQTEVEICFELLSLSRNCSRHLALNRLNSAL
jgi:hypothetical protein